MSTNTFANLCINYTTSEALYAFLKSEEGGNLQVITASNVPEVPLSIIRYNKEKSDFSKEHVGYFRSVVWDDKTNRPVCVAPFRSVKSEEVDPFGSDSPVVVEEFVDGTMINMFWYKHGWVLTTRSNLGANNSFYGSRSYAELFWEAFRASNLTLDMLDKEQCYSWVLQHPEERIVVAAPYGIPRIRLVGLSQIRDDDGSYEVSTTVNHSPEIVKFFPEQYPLHSFQECKDRVVAWGKRFGASWQGLVVKSGVNRWKFRSQQYMEARALRGNQAKREYLWLEHWGKGTLFKYLNIYKEEEVLAMHVVANLKAETQAIYDTYMDVYFNRKYPLGQAPSKYRKFLWDLHQAKVGKFFGNTVKFVNGCETKRLLWLLHFDRRFGSEVAGSDVGVAGSDVGVAGNEVAAPHVDIADEDI
jgi:hypothetical protein